MLAIPKRTEKKHESCRFCEWLQKWDKWKKCEGEARCIEETDNEDFVAVLEIFPRIEGEILIISKKKYDEAYDDISDISKFSDKERNNLCEILGKTIKLMKDNLKAEKVFLCSFCEHWEKHEVEYEDKKTTEHLHFRLIPRYRGMRHKELTAERIFSIPPRKIALTDEMLKVLKDELLGKKQHNVTR